MDVDETIKYFQSRQNRVRQKVGNLGLRYGCLVTDYANTFYLTGYPVDGYWVLVYPAGLKVFVSPLLYDQAKLYFPEPQLVKTYDWIKSLVRVSKLFKLRAITIDPTKLSLSLYTKFTVKLKVVQNSGLVSDLRIVKDDQEIQCIRQSCKIATQVMDKIIPLLRPGRTEKYIAKKTELMLRNSGADKIAFDLIVAGNKNTAYPHHLSGEDKLQPDSLVTLDLGGMYQGYCSDITRTVWLGTISSELKRIYTAVKKAHRTGIKCIRPGIKANAVHQQVVEILKKYKYDRYFIHGTGHSLGIEVHEKPSLNSKDKTILKPGMVVTVEPGVYVPDVGGVRIEDTVLVTNTGFEILTQ